MGRPSTSIFHDVNTDGGIDVRDAVLVRDREGDALAGGGGGGAAGSLTQEPIGAEPITADDPGAWLSGLRLADELRYLAAAFAALDPNEYSVRVLDDDHDDEEDDDSIWRDLSDSGHGLNWKPLFLYPEARSTP